MKTTIFQRIMRGLGANVYGQLVTIAVQIVGVPILLHAWGVELYGEWLILFAIPAYLSITDLGFSQSAANDMTARVGRGDSRGALIVFQSLAVLVCFVALAGLIIVSLLAISLPLNNWLHISELTRDESRWVLWFLAVAVLVKLIDGVNHAGFRAHGGYALHLMIYNTTILVQYGAIWILAELGHGPVTAAAAFAGVQCLITPAVSIFLVLRHKQLKFGAQYASLHVLRQLIRPAIANVAMPLAQAINIQGMVLVVGAVLNPAAVVVFSTLRTLTRLAVRSVLSVSHALEPEMAIAWGAGNNKLLKNLFVRGMAVNLWLTVAIALSLFFLGEWIINTWTLGRVTMDRLLFDWLLLSGIATVLWYSSLIVLKAANRHLRAALWFVLSSLASIIIAALLLESTSQLANAGLALLIMDILIASYLLVLACSMTEISVYSLLRQLFDPRTLLNSVKRRKSDVS